ncbi:hypothetical protein A7982_12894 [Minicystis rosea]|nr:hypothetical protein A7982_12894 [Minicystis rosea]
MDCIATTPCAGAEAQCPLGTTCDTSLDEPYCMPQQLCDKAADCASGEYCATLKLSTGICVLVDPTTCTDATCGWPFVCTDGSCGLFCNDAECPTGMSCEENRCQPN